MPQRFLWKTPIIPMQFLPNQDGLSMQFRRKRRRLRPERRMKQHRADGPRSLGPRTKPEGIAPD
jgi:hypothetical protein